MVKGKIAVVRLLAVSYGRMIIVQTSALASLAIEINSANTY